MGYKVEIKLAEDENEWPRKLKATDPDGYYVTADGRGLIAILLSGGACLDCLDRGAVDIADLSRDRRPLAKGEQIIITKE